MGRARTSIPPLLMIRDDDSRITFRELRPWLLPAFIVLVGLALFFLAGSEARTAATPIRVEGVGR